MKRNAGTVGQDSAHAERSTLGEVTEVAANIAHADVTETTDLATQNNGHVSTVDDMFSRGVNGGCAIKSLVFKKTLTKPLTSMNHLRELLMTCIGEMYEMILPIAGRADKPGPATVIEAVNAETGEEILLVCNTMMVSAFQRAIPPLAGRSFALRSGDIKADKKYRVIDVVEVDIQR